MKNIHTVKLHAARGETGSHEFVADNLADSRVENGLYIIDYIATEDNAPNTVIYPLVNILKILETGFPEKEIGAGREADKRPVNCRNRQRDEGQAYPKSGCEYCRNGGLMGCPFEKDLLCRGS